MKELLVLHKSQAIVESLFASEDQCLKMSKPGALCLLLQEEGGLVDVETVEDVPVDVETVEDMTQTIDELRKSVGASSRSLW